MNECKKLNNYFSLTLHSLNPNFKAFLLPLCKNQSFTSNFPDNRIYACVREFP